MTNTVNQGHRDNYRVQLWDRQDREKWHMDSASHQESTQSGAHSHIQTLRLVLNHTHLRCAVLLTAQSNTPRRTETDASQPGLDYKDTEEQTK